MGNSENVYDVIVIGAGPAGYVTALECGRRGMKTALVDDKEALGGTCLNIGCIPSKALLESSEMYFRLVDRGGEHGIVLGEKGVRLDIGAMMARKDAVVGKLTGGIAALMKARKVEVIRGLGRVETGGTVRVEAVQGSSGGGAGGRLLSAPRIVLAAGSRPTELPILPFDGKRVIDSTGALALDRVPKSLAVIGGGAVGLELGSVWSRLGAKVTVIEALDRIVPGADTQVSRALAAALKGQGLEIRTGVRLEGAEVGSRRVKLMLSGDESLSVERVLAAVGRRAELDSPLGAGVVPKRSGDGRFFAVDENFATSVEGLYAVGDVAGGPMLAHKAEEDGMILAAHLAGEARPPWGGPVPGIVYTEPEAAWAGESEDSLKAAGKGFAKGVFPFAANGRALASDAAEGFVKLLSTPGDGRLLGASIVGRGASELIMQAVSVMAMGGSAEDIALTVHGHPTLSEAGREAALALIGRPLHRA